jgi:hypothetical protein
VEGMCKPTIQTKFSSENRKRIENLINPDMQWGDNIKLYFGEKVCDVVNLIICFRIKYSGVFQLLKKHPKSWNCCRYLNGLLI